MAEQAKPCPHCKGTEIRIAPRWYSGDGMVLTCQNGDCLARIWGLDEADVIARWNRRTPGPATKAMLIEVRCALLGGWRESPISPDAMESFVAEWPDPATHPAPEQPVSSPWKCCVCGEPVRIADDLRPYHLSGPTNHEAELSDEDKRTLADGLRLTD
jgi:hypothetical protein